MSTTHELVVFDKCSLLNSGYSYHEGYDRAVCACGWKSAASKDHKALVALWEIHSRRTATRDPGTETEG